jgi:hypothetical protein
MEPIMSSPKIGNNLIFIGSIIFFFCSLINIFANNLFLNQGLFAFIIVAITLFAFLFSRLFKQFKKEKIGNVVFGLLLLILLISLVCISDLQLRVITESAFYAILSGTLFAETIKFRK